MALQDVLATRGLTASQAKAFLLTKLGEPGLVYTLIDQTGVSFDEFGGLIGYTKAQVQTYFSQPSVGSTASALAKIGLTQTEARGIVNATLEAGGAAPVFNATKALGLDIKALAALSGRWSVGQLESQFTAAGLNPGDIGGATAVAKPAGSPTKALVSADVLSLAPVVVAFNTATGAMSNAALKSAVLARGISEQVYNAFFDPTQFTGAEDGTFSTADLGFGHLGAFAATRENVESLFYGTLIKGYGSVDQAEAIQIGTFAQANQSALIANDPAAVQAYMKVLTAAFEDSTAAPYYPVALQPLVVAQGAVAAINLVGITGRGVGSLFDAQSLLENFGSPA